jgi:hypothetical protein
MGNNGETPADRIRDLNEAFSSFAATSGLLERYYDMLREKVRYLTVELEERNAQLKAPWRTPLPRRTTCGASSRAWPRRSSFSTGTGTSRW